MNVFMMQHPKAQRIIQPIVISAVGVLTFAGCRAASFALAVQSMWGNWVIPLSLGVGTAFFCALMMDRLWTQQQRTKEQGKVDPRQKWSELARALELVVGSEQLESLIVGQISDWFDGAQTVLFVKPPDEDRFVFSAQIGREDHAYDRLTFAETGSLAAWLRTNETLLSLREDREVVEYLSEGERSALARLDADLCLPLCAMNKLVGMAFIHSEGGHTISEGISPASTEDLSFQVGLALENALLADQQKLRLRRLYRAERLATTGQLAAGAAHEIRNPLTAISSAIQFLTEDFPPDHRKRSVAEGLLEEVDRINRIIEGLLSFARPAEPTKEWTHLKPLLDQTLLLVQTTAEKRNVEIVTDFSAEDDRIKADPALLTQVFLNLTMNGIQAMPEGGRLNIRLASAEEARRGHRFRIAFEDSGVGISPEHLEQIFDPFYTTKEDGTGLGLPISYGIVRSHGGEMDVESEVGKGTKVVVML